MISIHREIPEDVNSIRHVNQQAFGQNEEAEIVDKLRKRGAATISLVAVEGNQIVGHILFSPVTIESEYSNFEAIALAPMSVLPPYQRKGIGSQLVRAGLEECRLLNHEIVVVLGHPHYYPRFGFVPATSRGVTCEFEVCDDAWMIMELREGALAGRRGTVKYQPEFHEVA